MPHDLGFAKLCERERGGVFSSLFDPKAYFWNNNKLYGAIFPRHIPIGRTYEISRDFLDFCSTLSIYVCPATLQNLHATYLALPFAPKFRSTWPDPDHKKKVCLFPIVYFYLFIFKTNLNLIQAEIELKTQRRGIFKL